MTVHLVVNLDTGAFSYTSQTATSVLITENIGYTVSDNDGDLASSSLVVKVVPNSPPVAMDDNIITNVLSGNIVVPGELLLGNDSDANGDPLTASPTSFNTGWTAKGGDFTGSTGTVSFTGNNVQSINLNRSAFVANAATMTAVLVVSGALGAVSNNNANDEDRLNISLKQGETLTLDHNLAGGHITLEVFSQRWAVHCDQRRRLVHCGGGWQLPDPRHQHPQSRRRQFQRCGKLSTDHDRQLRRAPRTAPRITTAATPPATTMAVATVLRWTSATRRAIP